MEENIAYSTDKVMASIEGQLQQYGVTLYNGDGTLRPFGDVLADLTFEQNLPKSKIVKIGNWKFLWYNKKYVGALKYRGNTDAKLLDEEQWKALSLFKKILNLVN